MPILILILILIYMYLTFQKYTYIFIYAYVYIYYPTIIPLPFISYHTSSVHAVPWGSNASPAPAPATTLVGSSCRIHGTPKKVGRWVAWVFHGKALSQSWDTMGIYGYFTGRVFYDVSMGIYTVWFIYVIGKVFYMILWCNWDNYYWDN